MKKLERKKSEAEAELCALRHFCVRRVLGTLTFRTTPSGLTAETAWTSITTSTNCLLLIWPRTFSCNQMTI